MAKTEFVYLKGKTKWFRPEKPNEWGKRSHVLYPDADSLKILWKLKESTPTMSGIKNEIRKDEDGEYISISRPSSKEIKGKIVAFEPPVVLDGSMTLPDGSSPPLRGVFVGNGSDVITKIAVYSYNQPGSPGKRGRAIRWESSRVDNLIPYEGRKDFDEEEMKLTKGIDGVEPAVQVKF